MGFAHMGPEVNTRRTVRGAYISHLTYTYNDIYYLKVCNGIVSLHFFDSLNFINRFCYYMIFLCMFDGFTCV